MNWLKCHHCIDTLYVSAGKYAVHCGSPTKATWLRAVCEARCMCGDMSKDTYCWDHWHRRRWGGRRRQSRHWEHKAMGNVWMRQQIKQTILHLLLLKPYLPRSRSFRGPYLSMTMPMGRVMADSRKEPTVNARFSISSWSLQMGQPFMSRYSSESGGAEVDMLEKLRLELFSGWKRRAKRGND